MADFPDRAAPAVTALDRPRERLLASGPRALSDADLVALLVGTGTGPARSRRLTGPDRRPTRWRVHLRHRHASTKE